MGLVKALAKLEYKYHHSNHDFYTRQYICSYIEIEHQLPSWIVHKVRNHDIQNDREFRIVSDYI